VQFIDATAKVVVGASVGRPNKSMQSADAEAAGIIEIALMVKLGRIEQLKSRGLTQAAALRQVMKRRRGLVGESIGTTVIEMLTPPENRTQAALRLITEHDLPVTAAARFMKLDRRSLTRLVKDARTRERLLRIQTADFANRTEVRDVGADLIFLPENPPAQK